MECGHRRHPHAMSLAQSEEGVHYSKAFNGLWVPAFPAPWEPWIRDPLWSLQAEHSSWGSCRQPPN